MVDFSKLRQNKGSTKELLDAIKGLESQESYKDDRYWSPSTDKAGNGYAVIRFLPAPGEEVAPFVRLWSHSFQGPTGLWYIENSLTTLGQDDPVSEYNTVLWNSTTDDESPARKQAREQKRKLIFISNILVIDDPVNPENNGKVFLYKYGKKIFEKITEAMNPQFPGEKAMNPYDMWEGANFILKIRKQGVFKNYDKSEFSTQSLLNEDDKVLEEIFNKEYSLEAEVALSKFKPYEELKKRFYKVLAIEAKPLPEASSSTELKESAPSRFAEESYNNGSDSDDEDEEGGLEFFKKLAARD